MTETSTKNIVLSNGDIPEESLSKQNNFCLELFRAQQPTTDVANAELRQWQTQLLDVIDQEQINDRMIIWVMEERVTKEIRGFSRTSKAFTERIA